MHPLQKTAHLPKTHKAIVYPSPGSTPLKTAITTIPTPRPAPGEVLVRLTHSGVCSSDLGILTNSVGFPPTPENQVGGHEGVGHVVAFGESTADTALAGNLKIGDRVGIKWVSAICGCCMPCLSGRDALCEKVKVSGYVTPGTFQEYVIAPATYVTPIPEGLESEIAAPMLCGGLTVYSALRKSGAQAGDFVVIPGAGGGLGHLAVQIAARGMGLRVIGIDAGPKEEFVKSLGAEVFFDITKYSQDAEGSAKLAEDVKAATPRGAGAASVIVCVGSTAVYAQAIHFLGFGGSLVCVGLTKDLTVPIGGAFPNLMIAQELRILGSAVGNRKEAIEVLEMAARGVVKTHVTVEPMSKLTEVFEKLSKGQLHGRVVIDLGKE
ncbi:chaperonin 10-like protein [Rhypophila decipiens]|uniref:Chaperonin 10-like protein n=1 Tax=Rhypophila decipiens TaxID=261697 RepID=A0AAN6Y1L5_9PEZI|nr:chaperonin 10-like protein [Rhypophila decipiens]